MNPITFDLYTCGGPGWSYYGSDPAVCPSPQVTELAATGSTLTGVVLAVVLIAAGMAAVWASNRRNKETA